METGDRGLNDVLYQHLPGWTEEHRVKPDRIIGVLAAIRAEDLPVTEERLRYEHRFGKSRGGSSSSSSSIGGGTCIYANQSLG